MKSLKYALDQNNELAHINKAQKGNSYYCPNCHGELLIKQGQVRVKHFAHKKNTPHCTYETYLHELAKMKFKQWFDQQDKFPIRFKVEKLCEKAHECKWCHYYDETHGYECIFGDQFSPDFNLKQYYGEAILEQPYMDFRADILLRNKKIDGEPIFIEITVTHRCDQTKIDSGIRIIEIEIKSEDQLDQIVKKSVLEENEYIKFHNFKRTPALVSNRHKELYKFVLFDSLKGYCPDTTCKTYTQRSKGIYELTFENWTVEYFPYKIGIIAAYNAGYNKIRNCYLCKYYKDADGIYSDDLPIFCCLYKKLNTEKYCKSNQAENCSAFRVDYATLKAGRGVLRNQTTDVWEKEPKLRKA